MVLGGSVEFVEDLEEALSSLKLDYASSPTPATNPLMVGLTFIQGADSKGVGFYSSSFLSLFL